MKVKLIYLIFVLICFETSSVLAQNFVWAKAMGGADSDNGNSIALDASGNVYTTGTFSGTSDFDPSAGVFNLTSAGSVDVFISKLDAGGNFVWAKAIGGTGAENSLSIAIDISGNVLTTCYFNGTADFDPSASVFNLTSVGGPDIFISKLDATGNFVWAKAMGGIGADIGRSIIADGSGNVYTTGYFSGTADFDPGSGVFNLISSGAQDIFISKLNAAGNFIWAKQIGGIGTDIGYSVDLDGSGNVYTTGSFSGTVDFDPGSGVFNLIGTGNDDIFVSKLDGLGNFVWAKAIGGTTQDIAYSIVLDASGNAYTTGLFTGTADFDPSAGVFNLTAVGGPDIFISKLDVGGNFVWAKTIGGVGGENSLSISLDASGNIFTTGYFSGTADFDPSTGVFNLTTIGGIDIFISKLDATGNFVWAKAIGGPNNDQGNSIALDGLGNIYTTGVFSVTVDFDPGVGIFNLTSAGNSDIFVHKMCQVPMMPSSINGGSIVCFGVTNTFSIASITGATSYAWSLPSGWTGSSVTNTISATPGISGIFTVTASNGCGISPIQTLNISVNPSPTIGVITGNTIICGPPFQQTATLTANGANTYTWNPGGTGTSIAVSPSVTTVYTITGTDINGCMNSSVFTQSVSTCSDIYTSNSSEREIKLYPNPNNGIFTIQIGLLFENYEAVIINNLGQTLFKKKINSGSNTIKTELADGVYFYHIKMDGKIINKGKIIIEN